MRFTWFVILAAAAYGQSLNGVIDIHAHSDPDSTARSIDAIDLAKNLVELPRLGPKQERVYNMGRERLVDTLVTYELWDDLISLRDTMYLALPPKDSATSPG